MSVTAGQVKAIIEQHVRKFLKEEEEKKDNANILSALRVANMADIAKALIGSGIWSDMDIDTARSELSKISRGLLPLKPELAEFIKRELQRTASKMKI